jgi:hypothetical protein
MFSTRGTVLATLGAVLFGVYLRAYRSWHSRWGATDEEVALAMPGDELIGDPSFNVTRAISIQARPEEIWPSVDMETEPSPLISPLACYPPLWYTEQKETNIKPGQHSSSTHT